MEPTPLSRQRSKWTYEGKANLGEALIDVYRRQVSDGQLTAFIGLEPDGLHLSISHRFMGRTKKPAGRYPNWDEIAHCRYVLLPEDIEFIMYLPALKDYVAVHDTCFHLHQYPPFHMEEDMPTNTTPDDFNQDDELADQDAPDAPETVPAAPDQPDVEVNTVVETGAVEGAEDEDSTP